MECDIFLNCDSVTVTVEGNLFLYKATPALLLCLPLEGSRRVVEGPKETNVPLGPSTSLYTLSTLNILNRLNELHHSIAVGFGQFVELQCCIVGIRFL